MCLKVLIFFNLTNEYEIKFIFFICAKERMLEFKVLMLHGVYVSVCLTPIPSGHRLPSSFCPQPVSTGLLHIGGLTLMCMEATSTKILP